MISPKSNIHPTCFICKCRFSFFCDGFANLLRRSDAVFGKTTNLEVEVSSLSTPIFYEIGAADSRRFEVKAVSDTAKNENHEYALILKSWSDYGESAQVSILSSKNVRSRLYETENFGGKWSGICRERLEKDFSTENSKGRYALHNSRIEGKLGRKGEGIIVSSMMP